MSSDAPDTRATVLTFSAFAQRDRNRIPSIPDPHLKRDDTDIVQIPSGVKVRRNFVLDANFLLRSEVGASTTDFVDAPMTRASRRVLICPYVLAAVLFAVIVPLLAGQERTPIGAVGRLAESEAMRQILLDLNSETLILRPDGLTTPEISVPIGSATTFLEGSAGLVRLSGVRGDGVPVLDVVYEDLTPERSDHLFDNILNSVERGQTIHWFTDSPLDLRVDTFGNIRSNEDLSRFSTLISPDRSFNTRYAVVGDHVYLTIGPQNPQDREAIVSGYAERFRTFDGSFDGAVSTNDEEDIELYLTGIGTMANGVFTKLHTTGLMNDKIAAYKLAWEERVRQNNRIETTSLELLRSQSSAFMTNLFEATKRDKCTVVVFSSTTNGEVPGISGAEVFRAFESDVDAQRPVFRTCGFTMAVFEVARGTYTFEARRKTSEGEVIITATQSDVICDDIDEVIKVEFDERIPDSVLQELLGR